MRIGGFLTDVLKYGILFVSPCSTDSMSLNYARNAGNDDCYSHCDRCHVGGAVMQEKNKTKPKAQEFLKFLIKN